MKDESKRVEKKISDAVIRRLPRYYRRLCALEKEGVFRISSSLLGKSLELKASQIRQDLNSFGAFGQQGFGYSVSELRNKIAHILSLDGQWKMVVVGAGNIGKALSNYAEFENEGFSTMALFDNDINLIGTKVGDIPIYDAKTLGKYITDNGIDVVALTVPANIAQDMVNIIEKAGAGAVWNFAPIDVFSHSIIIENIHLTDSLMAMSYKLKEQNKNKENKNK